MLCMAALVVLATTSAADTSSCVGPHIKTDIIIIGAGALEPLVSERESVPIRGSMTMGMPFSKMTANVPLARTQQDFTDAKANEYDPASVACSQTTRSSVNKCCKNHQQLPSGVYYYEVATMILQRVAPSMVLRDKSSNHVQSGVGSIRQWRL